MNRESLKANRNIMRHMAKQFPFAEAEELAGRVFGEILQRDSDSGGYSYVLDCLQTGKKSLQQIVVEFISSEEYIDKFVGDDPPSVVVQTIHRLLVVSEPEGEEAMKAAQRHYVRFGLKAYAEYLIQSDEYQRSTGPDGVPSAARPTEPGTASVSARPKRRASRRRAKRDKLDSAA